MSVAPVWDDLARLALQAYPEFHGPFSWEPIHGGFSGAKLWRVMTETGSFALRCWPSEQSSPSRLDTIHTLMHQALERGLRFVPQLLRTNDGATWQMREDRAWEVSTWMRGQADFTAQPSLNRLLAAVRALGKLHRAWRPEQQLMAPSPGIQRRRARLAAWPTVRQQLQAAPLPEGPVEELTCRSLAALVVAVPKALQQLQPWCGAALPLQPCLADIWHDHVLFRGERVTGIVDYGSVRRDHISVDLARLLGSLVPDDPVWWAAALDSYSNRRPLLPAEWDLVRVLDISGVVVGVMNWLEWLVLGTKVIENREAALRRWQVLLRRLERMA
jgi:Ser/Thr protein kinase RdoA (MazF antagonist)